MGRSSLVKGPARFIILLAAGICTLVLGTALYAATLNQAPPALPHAFNGTVTIAGDPAPVGTEVCGQIGGTERGCITITTAGQYGAPGLGGAKLLVQAPDSESGETISFRVTPPGTVGGAAAETDVYTPGDVETLNLTLATMPLAPTPTPTATPTFTPTPTQTPTPTPRPAATATPLPPLTIVPEEEVTPPPPEPTPEGSQSGPVTEVVQPDQTTKIEVSDEGVTLEFSETVYEETLQVRVQPLDPDAITTAPTIVPGSDVQVSRAFHVSLYYADGRPAPGVHLWRPARISITLTDQEVEDMGGQSQVYQLFLNGRLVIFRSEDGISWSALDTSFDLSTNTFTAWVSGFSVFTLVGPQGGQPEPAETPVSTPTAASTPIPVTASPTPAPTAAVTPLPTVTTVVTPSPVPTASASPSATTLPAWTPSPTVETPTPSEPPSGGGTGWILPVTLVTVLLGVVAAGGGIFLWRRRSV